MASFKVKLVLYFLLLSLLPVAAAFWGFSLVASHSETRRVDGRLQAGLRAGLVAYQSRLDNAAATAAGLARNREFQLALERGDRAALARLVSPLRNVRIAAASGFSVGPSVPILAARRVADVFVTGAGYAGSVITFVPLDNELASVLRRSSGLAGDDALIVVDGSRIIASSPPVYGSLSPLPGSPRSVRIGGVRYRSLEAGALDDFTATRLAVVSPQHAIDAAAGATERRLLVFLAIVLVIVAIVAYLEGRSIVRSLGRVVGAARGIAAGRLEERVPVQGRDEFAQLGVAFNEMADQLEQRLAELEAERGRLRDAFTRFGDALGATHDSDQLTRVVLETALHATGAIGAALVDDRGITVELGDLDSGGERLEIPLSASRENFGTLILVAPEFGPEERLTANSLAAQAVVALENARLHAIVEQQALVDGLTELANRRRSEEALSAELARAERFGSSLTVVFGDLDDFKGVNDEHGHRCGDLVLREFAAVLRESLREADLAGRWGGEEFLLLLPGTDTEGGVQLAERVREAFESRVILSPEGSPVAITCSFGVASYPDSGDAETLLAAADGALYEAKHAGKNRVEAALPVIQRP